MPRFTAIPVGQGDAFYLERENCSILVDGGRSTVGLRQKLNDLAARPLDIIVCTHNDADHVDGIIGLLRQERACKEIWLPGKWIEVIGHACNSSLFDKLLAEIREIPVKHVLEKIETLRDGVSILFEPTAFFPQEGAQSFEQNANERSQPPTDRPNPLDYHIFRRELLYHSMYSRKDRLNAIRSTPALTEEQAALFSELIEAMDRIMMVALLAMRHRIPIRWFEYDTTQPGGGIENVLVPLNAREVRFHKPRANSVMDVIELTVVNKESLVLWAPPSEDMPGVFFSADSQLTDIDLSGIALNNAICTAPHHGSSDNDCAYSHVSLAAENASTLRWVRSDGRFRKRPGAAYLSTTTRFCTVCRPAQRAPYQTAAQPLSFIPSNGQWTPSGTRQCNCAPVP
jgi:hypothetical protein